MPSCIFLLVYPLIDSCENVLAVSMRAYMHVCFLRAWCGGTGEAALHRHGLRRDEGNHLPAGAFPRVQGAEKTGASRPKSSGARTARVSVSFAHTAFAHTAVVQFDAFKEARHQGRLLCWAQFSECGVGRSFVAVFVRNVQQLRV